MEVNKNGIADSGNGGWGGPDDDHLGNSRDMEGELLFERAIGREAYEVVCDSLLQMALTNSRRLVSFPKA